MSVDEIIKSVEFLVDSAGNKKAAVLDWPAWEELLAFLEDLEDAAELSQARQEEDELIPWEQVKSDYRAAHPDADV